MLRMDRGLRWLAHSLSPSQTSNMGVASAGYFQKDECLLATHRAGLCHDCKSGQVVFLIVHVLLLSRKLEPQ